jgi:hypothetical protein
MNYKFKFKNHILRLEVQILASCQNNSRGKINFNRIRYDQLGHDQPNPSADRACQGRARETI